MPRALWNQALIAEATPDQIEVVENNLYFPAGCVTPGVLRPSSTHTVCPWKGTASYFDVVVNGEVNRDAAWTYPDPKPAAEQVRGRIAFWRGVKTES